MKAQLHLIHDEQSEPLEMPPLPFNSRRIVIVLGLSIVCILSIAALIVLLWRF